MSKHPFVPAYILAGYKTYQNYLESEAWDKTKWRIIKQYPYSRYCYVCDSTRSINLHHENYWAIPKEQLFRDVIYLCQTHHFLTHRETDGSRTVLEQFTLRRRRKQLRKEYLAKNIKPSTVAHFLLRFLYRLFW
jgi:hypothetical protein